MYEQSFIKGFKKQAAANGIDPYTVDAIIKYAFGMDDFKGLGQTAMDYGNKGLDWVKDKLQLNNPGFNIDNVPNPNPTGKGIPAINSILQAGLPTAALGAGVGAIGGGLANKKDRLRGAITGGLAGGALGFAGGAGNRAYQLADNTRSDFSAQQSQIADSATTDALRYENGLPLTDIDPAQTEYLRWLQQRANESSQHIDAINKAPWHQYFNPQGLKSLRPRQAPELNQ